LFKKRIVFEYTIRFTVFTLSLSLFLAHARPLFGTMVLNDLAHLLGIDFLRSNQLPAFT